MRPQNVQQLSLKHALKTLQSWKKSQSADQQKWASVAERLVQGWISRGHNLAKGNTSKMNAIAFMLENLGRYKASDTLPARAYRRTMRSGENKCTTVVGDAYVFGNKHKNFKYGNDWPGKDPDYQALDPKYTPESAAHLAGKSRKWPCLSILSNPASASYGDPVVRGGRSIWTGFRQRGHAGLFIANDSTISANLDHGVRFADWKSAYRDEAKNSGEALLTRRYMR